MERLTSWNEDCVQINGHALGYATIGELLQMAERLAAYEDTQLTPETCAEYKKFEDEVVASGKTFGRLVELLHADKAGRCVVLPCVPGDTLWLSQLFYTQPQGPLPALVHAIRFDADGIMIVTGKRRFAAEAIEKTVFYTREEAERAMEGRKHTARAFWDDSVRSSCDKEADHA